MPLQNIDLVVAAREELRVGEDQDTRVRRWVNWALREVGRKYTWRWTLFLHPDFTSTAATPNVYALPTDFRSVSTVRVRDTSSQWKILTPRHVEIQDRIDANDSTQGDVSNIFYVEGNNLVLVPGFNSTNGLVRLRYHRTPPILVNDSDISIAPDAFRDVLVDGAVMRGSRYLWNDKGDQDRIKRDFLAGVHEMISQEKEGPGTEVLGQFDGDFGSQVAEAGTA